MFHSSGTNRTNRQSSSSGDPNSDGDVITPPHQQTEKGRHNGLPTSNYKPHMRHRKTPFIRHEGESGRSFVHPWKFLKICGRSSSRLSRMVNVLWPVVPVAIAVHFALPSHHLLVFVLSYIAMVPSANLIGFAGQELARKMPKVLGVLMENMLGSVVEIILFMVLIVKHSQSTKTEAVINGEAPEISITVIRAAILGSILANLLLALGSCFVAGGLRHEEQVFHEVISEVGSNLLLVAGFGLVITTAVAASLPSPNVQLNNLGGLVDEHEQYLIEQISHATAIILLIAYVVYLVFQMSTHHGLYDEVLEGDEQRDKDGHKDLAKEKLTFTECIIALVIAIACVAMMAVFLVLEIHDIVESHGVAEQFMGLILVPLVEKAAEHLTALDEAWDNQANFALIHVLGSSVQTALLNAPLVVIVGWGLGTHMDLNFRPFESIVLVLAIIVVGNFLRDGKSNYLEGALCVLTYVIIAVAAFFFPNEEPAATASETTTHATMMLARSVLGQ